MANMPDSRLQGFADAAALAKTADVAVRSSPGLSQSLTVSRCLFAVPCYPTIAHGLTVSHCLSPSPSLTVWLARTVSHCLTQVVFVGLHPHELVRNNSADSREDEGKDRPYTFLPGLQSELVQAIVAANPNTVCPTTSPCTPLDCRRFDPQIASHVMLDTTILWSTSY